jgi:hypothetical protein
VKAFGLLNQLEPSIRGLDPFDPVRLQLEARGAQLYLVLVDKASAIRCLGNFVSSSDGRSVVVDAERLDEMSQQVDPFSGGLTFAQAANLLYRSLDAELGAELAERADSYLSFRDGNWIDVELARLENRIWWSRLLWRSGQQPRAETLLAKTVDELGSSFSETVDNRKLEETGGLDLLIALALDLWASWDWVRGTLDDGRRRIYEALFLLANGPAHDPVRLAHAQHTAARIEASDPASGSAWALRMLAEAEELLGNEKLHGGKPHPFVMRIRAQRAQTEVRSGRLREARQTLDRVDLSSLTDEDERSFVESDAALTEVWLAEGEATRDGWQKCLELSRKLVRKDDRLPLRLHLEGMLHHGIALVRTDNHREGQKYLQQARIEGRGHQRKKIELAACLGLVESFSSRKETWSRAVQCWEDARLLAFGLRSRYLGHWFREVGTLMQRLELLEVDPKRPLNPQLERFEEIYLQNGAAAARNMDELVQWSGVPRPTLYRKLANFHIDPPSERRRRSRGKDRAATVGTPAPTAT